MVVLDSTTKSLQFVLASAVTANQLTCVAAWADVSGTTITPGATDAQSNNTTAATIVAAPASSTQRQLKSLDIFNADTADATVSVVYNSNSTLRTLVTVTLKSSETLQFAESAWSVIDTNGKLRTSGGGSSGSSNGPNVTATTLGATFNPTVELVSGSTATVTWASDDGVTATGVNPTLTFSGAGTRHVKMTVADSSGNNAVGDVITFNLGFNSTDDAGTYNMGSSYNKSSENVSAVANVNVMTGLIRFAAANISSLGGTLDFSGMSWLQYIECFQSNVESANVAGCTSLIRLCLEQNNLTAPLNLNPIAPTVKDVRAAHQNAGINGLTFTNLAIPMVSDYHFCVRDQTVTNMPNFTTMFPTIQELWIWNTGQSGTLKTNSSSLVDVRAFQNTYTSADFTNQFTTGSGYLDLNTNSLTSVALTGCTALGHIDLSHNSLNQAAVDGVLATVDSWSTSGGTLTLTNNSVPSSTGTSHATSLTGRGWTVAVDTTGGGGGGGGSIAVVQSATHSGSGSLAFSSAVTSGNSVVVAIAEYATSGSNCSSSAVKLGGSTVSGTTALFNSGTTNGVNSASSSGNVAYVSLWMLPNCPGSQTTVSATLSSNAIGMIAYEVSGLGTTPAVDQTSSGSSISATTANSGTTGAITASPEFIVGASMIFSGVGAGSPTGFTHNNTGDLWAGYQIATSSGGTYNWSQTSAGTPWAAALATIN